MSQGVLCQKIKVLGKKLWPVARVQTDTKAITEYYTLLGLQPFKLLAVIWAVQKWVTRLNSAFILIFS